MSDVSVRKGISSRLRSWRKHLSLTQEEYASITGLHIGVLRKYENAVNVPGGEALIAIARTGVNLNWLLLGEGPMCLAFLSHKNPKWPKLEILETLLEGIEDKRRCVIIEEIISRVEDAKRISDLEELVHKLYERLSSSN